MYKECYEKFKQTVKDFDLISADTKKIVIGMSGGKDAAIMTHFLMDYKKEFRPDLELIMILAQVPHPFFGEVPEVVFDCKIDERQKNLLKNQIEAINKFSEYWAKYLELKYIPVQQELIDNRILHMNWSCMMCFNTKMKAFNEYLKTCEDNTLFACGWTKWDAHYTLFSHMLKSDGSKWNQVKKDNPSKYKADCVYLASFAAFPKVEMGIPGKKITRINPMIEFDDFETREMSKELNIPVLDDICGQIFANTFEQDRRFISKYLEIFSNNQRHLNVSEDSLLFSYRSMKKFMEDIELLPPIEEVNGILYDAYNSDFEEVFQLLKKRSE